MLRNLIKLNKVRPLMTSSRRMLGKLTSDEKDVPYETSIHRDDDVIKGAELPGEVDAVVIGAGSLGCSTAYHLAKFGAGKVLLLEKHRVTSGTTWHTAGILYTFRGSESETLMQMQTRDLIRDELPQENGGESAGWLQCGTLHTNKTEDETKNNRRITSMIKAFGVEVIEVNKNEIPDIHPLVNCDDIHAAEFTPECGTMDPATYCMAYIKAGKKYGADLYEGCDVTNILTEEDDLGLKRVSGVVTNMGTVKTKQVFNCAGAWCNYIGDMVGLRVPQLVYEHAYVVTEGIEGILGRPQIKDALTVYIKPQGDAVQFGGYESTPHLVKNIPKDFHFGLYDIDWDIFGQHIEAAVNRIPAIGEAGIRTTVCGPETFTPDTRPIMGESPQLRGFFYGSGFNSGGMMMGGGAGRQIALLALRGYPEFDIFNCDVKRFQPSLSNYNKWVKETSHESFARRYMLVYPYDQPLGGRNQKYGPLHQQHLDSNALMGCRFGYERPAYYLHGEKQENFDVKNYDFYGSYGHEKNDPYPYLDEVLNDCTYNYATKSHNLVGQECLTCRTSCAVIDSSYMAKLALTGRDAVKLATLAFTRDVARAKKGQFLYMLMLNANGGIENDGVATIVTSPKGDDEVYLTVSSSSAVYVRSLLQRLAQDRGMQCLVEDRTDDVALVSVQGPNSLDVMSEVTRNCDVTNLKYARWEKGEIGGSDAMIGRLSFVGELGFEVHCDKNDASKIYDVIMEQVEKRGGCLAGYRAMESLSNEVGFHHWPHTISIHENPVEARMLSFCQKNKKYIGSTKLAELRKEKPNKILACVTMDSDVPMFGHEVLWKDGKVVGDIRSAAYSHSLDTNMGWAYVKSDDCSDDVINSGKYQVERMAVKYDAGVTSSSVFDPTLSRIRGNYDVIEQEKLLDRLAQLKSAE